MTPVQAASLPAILEDKDLIVQAKTGSGKTAAFGLGLLQKINPKYFGVQAMVLCPTRELADQVAKEVRQLARCIPNIKLVVLCGGKPLGPQADSLEHGAHIVVGTPGRLQDHLSRSTLPLFEIHTLVLDEADRMLDMGFYDAIKKIASNIRTKKQTLMFSATYPPKISELASSLLKNPKKIKVEEVDNQLKINQVAYEVGQGSKQKELLHILKSKQPKSCLIFANLKSETEYLSDFLCDNKFLAQELNGNLDQRQRDETLLMFANGTIPILVATDVASRGIDIKDIELVINYDLPNDRELYTHRIGRTGRAGTKGEAISLYTSSQKEKISQIAPEIDYDKIANLRADSSFVLTSNLNTVCINGGKKSKLRAGDILGTLCKDIGIDGKHIGKINIHDKCSYVAIYADMTNKVLQGIQNTKIKNKKFKAWAL